MLEGKLVSKNVLASLSTRNISPPAISLLTNVLKFLLSANKVDWTKLKR